MDPQEDLIDRDITLTVLLPGGQETTATVHGSKPVMDVLVTLCAQHHLVPSDHAIKLISTNQNHINFKPNSMIGSLEFERVVLQTKGSENKKKPHVPVATVRLLINYKKTHKAVVRINPTVPLAELMPTVCEKCEFDPDATILLRTYQSEEPLDLTKTLNDYGIRELYAKDIKVVSNTLADPVSTHKGGDEEQKSPVKEKNHREKGNKGFFGLFKKNKKTPEQAATGSASTSPEWNGQCADRVNGVNGHSTLPVVPADMPKKRHAPQPPMTALQSVACGLHARDFSDLSESDSARKQGQLSRISSTESSLKRTKRRAPPPPCDYPTPPDADNKVEEAQWDNKSSYKYKARIADHCPAIAKVMSELAESLQARKQRTPSSVNSSISQNQLDDDSSTSLFSEHHTPEAELEALSGCQLQRNPSEREGLTTFTVVPQRRQQSRQCFEVPLNLKTPDATKAEQELCPGDPVALEMPTTELLEAVPTEPFRNGCKGSDTSEHLEVLHLQPVEQENQACTDVESENLENEDEEDQYIQPKNTELESVESLQNGVFNLERSSSMINNLELRDSWANHSKPANKLADKSPTDSKAGIMEQENQACTDVESENLEHEDEEDQYIQPKNTELESVESLQSGVFNLERSSSMINNLELRDSWANHSKPANKLADKSPTDSKAGIMEQENQACTDVESENLEHEDEEDQCIQPKNTELESAESLQSGVCNLEHSSSMINNPELRDGWANHSKPANKLADRSPTDPKADVVEQEEMEEHPLVETGEEKDWVEEYKERRRKFLGGDNGLKKLDVWGKIQREFTNTQEEKAMQEMDFPSPPPPVCWDENKSENEDLQTCDEDLDQWPNLDSKPKYTPYSQYSKPKANSTQTNGDPNTSSAENNCSSAPEHHGISFISKSHSTFDHCPPATVSLFALAVFQKAKRSKPGLDPNCSRRRELPVHTHSN
ncbi:cordon-bleu protein-like 1 isoform X1 [Labeo rohita]|uniref:cordon-bleu protein-like 1 isoform X1 n=1 Tax=Labeo rohita TaxID=84645 RepID=UPI0021E33B04|nr:cordon-bleu protein-like 1 isoform X1 [Labeo rohita]XP_050968313.1 cordon-bleu protein-like 1 isoform X1 [Labeo rohita]XP_050968314.1 cordon-bleu protein-like 1 isoform X1 [Labeo rohita]XP_050968315.1 cordon-bleu protein-like 1 isoform X1 [Labeo rohita]